MLSIKTLLKALFVLFLASNYKSLPLAYFVRFYYIAIKRIFVPVTLKKWGLLKSDYFTYKHPKSPEGLGAFAPVTFHTYNSAFECDMFLHKSNSTYFTELDIVRTDALCRLFGKFFDQYALKYNSAPYIPVAAVQATFKKEIKPYARYDVTSRVLSWDDKWLFLLSKFTLPGQKNRTACTAITKYVFKHGKKTIPPKEYLEACGYYNEQAEKVAKLNYQLCKDFVETGVVQDIDMDVPEAAIVEN